MERVGVGREIMVVIRKSQLRFVGHFMRQERLENLYLTKKIEGERAFT